MKTAATLTRTGCPVDLDSIEVQPESTEETVTVVFNGRRIPVNADAKILPLHQVKKK